MFCNMLLILFHIYLPVDKPELMAVGQFHRWNFRYRPTQILSKVTNNHKKKAFGSEAKCFLLWLFTLPTVPIGRRHRHPFLYIFVIYNKSDDPAEMWHYILLWSYRDGSSSISNSPNYKYARSASYSRLMNFPLLPNQNIHFGGKRRQELLFE